MKISALLVVAGLIAGAFTITVVTAPKPPPPDLAAIELQDMRKEMKQQERQADEKLDWLYGKRRDPKGADQ